MMDAGYIVIAVFLALICLSIWAWRGCWNGKLAPYRHNPLPGHRQEWSSIAADTVSD